MTSDSSSASEHREQTAPPCPEAAFAGSGAAVLAAEQRTTGHRSLSAALSSGAAGQRGVHSAGQSGLDYAGHFHRYCLRPL